MYRSYTHACIALKYPSKPDLTNTKFHENPFVQLFASDVARGLTDRSKRILQLNHARRFVAKASKMAHESEMSCH